MNAGEIFVWFLIALLGSVKAAACRKAADKQLKRKCNKKGM